MLLVRTPAAVRAGLHDVVAAREPRRKAPRIQLGPVGELEHLVQTRILVGEDLLITAQPFVHTALDLSRSMSWLLKPRNFSKSEVSSQRPSSLAMALASNASIGFVPSPLAHTASAFSPIASLSASTASTLHPRQSANYQRQRSPKKRGLFIETSFLDTSARRRADHPTVFETNLDQPLPHSVSRRGTRGQETESQRNEVSRCIAQGW